MLWVFPEKAELWRWCKASSLNFSAPSEPVTTHTDEQTWGFSCKHVKWLAVMPCCQWVWTDLCVQAEHTDFSSVDDLSHRVCARAVKVLLKVTRLDQLPCKNNKSVRYQVSRWMLAGFVQLQHTPGSGLWCSQYLCSTLLRPKPWCVRKPPQSIAGWSNSSKNRPVSAQLRPAKRLSLSSHQWTVS